MSSPDGARACPDHRAVPPNMNSNACFLVIVARGNARRLKARLDGHAETRLVTTVADARPLVRSQTRWVGWWIDGAIDERAFAALWQGRPAECNPPVLFQSDARPDLDDTLFPHRWLPKSAPRAEERYFLGYCLAYEVTRRALIAAAVENLGREHELTVRQMELAAIATLPFGRDEILRGLGVSPNTLKTRVRQLLHVLQQDTLDALGKTILRQAIDLAPAPRVLHGAPPQATRRPVAGLLPSDRRSSVPVGRATLESIVVPALGAPPKDSTQAG